jgi:parallel beta-helix repeat protein
MAHKIQIKRGNKADIPVLNDGEMGLCIDTQEVFVGCNGTNIPVNTNKRTARFVVGTSTSGWTEKDCDYLCDGTADQTEINAAITALPATGGEIVILDGTYNITAKIDVTKDNVSIRGNGNATILKRMFNSTSAEGVITLTIRSGCKIVNLQIDGNKTSYTNSNNNGIYIRDSSNNNTITGNTCNNNSGSGICLYSSSNNTVTGNTCNNNNNGIYINVSSNNTVTGNTCIRGTGQTSDYASDQYTIILQGTANNYNLISSNNCMGKAPVAEGGTGNTLVNNKWDASDDIKDIRQQINSLDAYAVASGTDTYTATIDGYTLAEGKSVKIKFTNANTGASTLNINSLGAKAIKKSDGDDLSSGNIKAGQICNLVYTGSVFQLLGEGGEYELAGYTWTQRTSSFGTSTIYGVCYGQGMFVAVDSNGKLATSTDGTTWTQRTSSFGTTAIRGVCYGQGMFVAVGASGKLATSTDGTTWTQRTSSFGTTTIRGVCYGQGMFVAVGNNGKLATSTDGTTWTQRTSSFDTTIIYGVCYGQGMFVAVGYDGKLATSTDGTTWTQRTSSFDTTIIYGVCYGQGMFVAVGDNGKLATSTDGTTWTQRTSSFGTTTTIRGICYGQGMFVAVGNNGELATSTDGITWTQRTSSFDTTIIYGVCYGQGMFVAVGASGKIATSANIH